MSKPPQYGVVAMLDVLGGRTSGFDDTERLIGNLNNFLESEDLKKNWTRLYNLSSENTNLRVVQDTIIFDMEQKKRADESFSDPLLIACNAMFLLAATEWLMSAMVVGLKCGLPLRGAVAIGHYSLAQFTTNYGQMSAILGPAVSDAASWYEKADWLGLIATPACAHTISYFSEWLKEGRESPQGARFKDLRWSVDDKFVEYPVPLVDGTAEKLWALSWPDQWPSRRSFLSALVGLPVPFGTQRKYSNTLNFFDWYIKNKRPKAAAADPGVG
jgi:hypothetical protein